MTREWREEYSPAILRVSIADMIALRVRTGGRQNRELPKVLYQRLPRRALSLGATLPRDAIAVSIPGSVGREDREPEAGGFVIVYGRKPNGRYEADSVRFEGREFAFPAFCSVSRKWMEQTAGAANPVPGRYAYLAPSKEEWGVILRDSGFAAHDPERMPSSVTPELRLRLESRESSGLLVRLPVFAGSRSQGEDVLRVFARVEVFPCPGTGPARDWMEYDAYRKRRAVRARPPAPILPGFREWLRRLAEACGFECWNFRPGMLFGDRVEWWRDCCRRPTEHEGIDFAEGFRPGAGICPIPDGTPVPAIACGEVVAILDDFLAKSVVIRHHGMKSPYGEVFHTLLSHIRPEIGVRDAVEACRIVGSVSGTAGAGAPPHLHMTGVWIPEKFDLNCLTMDSIHPAFEPFLLSDFTAQISLNPVCSSASD